VPEKSLGQRGKVPGSIPKAHRRVPDGALASEPQTWVANEPADSLNGVV
jgi:hypothetical protein